MSDLGLSVKKAVVTLAIMCYHRFPDAEVVASDSLLRMFPEILKSLGKDGIKAVKFINSGPMRAKDWKEFGTTDPAKLGRLGVMPVDVLQDKFKEFVSWDHHGPDNAVESAIGEILEDATDALMSAAKTPEDAIEVEANLRALGAFVDVIEGNDLNAEDMAILGSKDKDPRWPNVAMQFRTFLFGLNLMMPDKPERVLQLGNMAVNGLLKVLRRTLEDAQPEIDAKMAEFTGENPPKLLTVKQLAKWHKRCSDKHQMESELKKTEVKKLFGWNNILTNVRALYANQPEYIKYFEMMADAAFTACQQEWEHGETDYWSGSTKLFNSVRVDPEAFDVNVEKQPTGREDLLNVVFGVSTSKWFGKVCRRGNLPKFGKKGKVKQERPHPDQPLRYQGQIIGQIFESDPEKGTKFLVSTKGGITLRPVAYQMRLADLRKKYWCLETEREGCLKIRVGDETAAKSFAQNLKAKSRIPGLSIKAQGKFVRLTRNRSTLVSHVAQLVQRNSGDEKNVIVIDREARDQIADHGNNRISVCDSNWDLVDVDVLYFADFLSSFGNAHNTNPDAVYCALTPDEILSVLLGVLKNSARQADRRAERRQPAAQSAE